MSERRFQFVWGWLGQVKVSPEVRKQRFFATSMQMQKQRAQQTDARISEECETPRISDISQGLQNSLYRNSEQITAWESVTSQTGLER